MLGGQQVCLKDGIAKLADGTIAGSATNLFEAMRRAMAFGIAEETAIQAATYNPACAIGAEDKVGSIQTGLYADFVVCSPDYAQKQVYIAGKSL